MPNYFWQVRKKKFNREETAFSIHGSAAMGHGPSKYLLNAFNPTYVIIILDSL